MRCDGWRERVGRRREGGSAEMGRGAAVLLLFVRGRDCIPYEVPPWRGPLVAAEMHTVLSRSRPRPKGYLRTFPGYLTRDLSNRKRCSRDPRSMKSLIFHPCKACASDLLEAAPHESISLCLFFFPIGPIDKYHSTLYDLFFKDKTSWVCIPLLLACMIVWLFFVNNGF
jgi:hypothetical protein